MAPCTYAKFPEWFRDAADTVNSFSNSGLYQRWKNTEYKGDRKSTEKKISFWHLKEKVLTLTGKMTKYKVTIQLPCSFSGLPALHVFEKTSQKIYQVSVFQYSTVTSQVP